MKHEWKKNINLDNKSKIEIEIHNIAFMDDTIWLEKGKKELEGQLNIADSFNRFNGIKVNPSKLKLIIINNKETSENTHIKYGLNETLIYSKKRDESTRFLGVWIAANNNKNFITNNNSVSPKSTSKTLVENNKQDKVGSINEK